jgi:hypothetical protein
VNLQVRHKAEGIGSREIEMQGLLVARKDPQMQDLVAQVASREKTGFGPAATRHIVKTWLEFEW